MKEFDIRLPPRLTECNVLIYSLHYYSGLTVIGGFVIDSAVGWYTLQKVFNVQSGLVLTSEVEGVFKLVHEVAQSGLILDSHVDIGALYKIIPKPSGIALLEEPARLFAEDILRASSGVELNSSLLNIQVSRSLGHGESGFIINSNNPSMYKHSFFNSTSGFALDADSLDIRRINRFAVDNGILLTAELKNLCYLICFNIDNGIVLDTEAAGTLIEVLYGTESGIELDTEAFVATTKAIHANSDFVLDAEVISIPVKVMKPEKSDLVIDTGVSADLKRYRLLEEVDDMMLEEMDDVTLEELDWVWLT